MPELARRMTLTSCHLDPARALVPVLARMPAAGIRLGDVLADSGYAHRDAEAWAIPLRQAGAQLIQDLHPHDRGPRGTHHGAIIANGSLYCPADPRDTAGARAAAPRRHPRGHRRARRRGPPSSPGTNSARSPPMTPTATTASPAPPPQARSAARSGPASMKLDRGRPEILTPPENPPACCTQQTITVPPEVAPRHRRNTTTRPRRTGAPTPGAPAPNGPSPPSRTPPPPASPAAGAA